MAADVTLRPRRSVLYMPGANERALAKAQTIPADALILDLEAAVAPDAKPETRDRVCAAATAGAYGRRKIPVRAHGSGTQWGSAGRQVGKAWVSTGEYRWFPRH